MRLSQRENLTCLDIWWRTIEISLFEIISKEKKIISKDKAAIVFKVDELKEKKKKKIRILFFIFLRNDFSLN